MDQNIQNVLWINNSRTAALAQILILFLSSLDNLPKDACIIFQKVLIILRKSIKNANLGLGGVVPP